MNEFLKPVPSSVDTRQETQSSRTMNDTDLHYTLCDRTDLNSSLSNYFVSFNLPYISTIFSTSSQLSLTHPELQQLNVDQMIIVPVEQSYYNEILDGRSVTFTFPQTSGATGSGAVSAKTIVSSTYSLLEKKQNDPLLGSNVAFLFSDDVNLPYSGNSANGNTDHSGNLSWDPSTSYVDRPPAVPYHDLNTDIDVYTDKRTSVDYAVDVNGPGYPSDTNQGYNYDIPVGFVALDKGWFIITHPSIVNNFPYTSGRKLSDNTSNAGATSSTTEIYLTDTTKSNVNFVDINVEYKTSVIALVFPTEFFFTTNPSWDREKNYQEQQNETYGYDAVSISEIALYNAKGEIIAISKLDRPLEKQYNDLVTFNLDINI